LRHCAAAGPGAPCAPSRYFRFVYRRHAASLFDTAPAFSALSVYLACDQWIGSGVVAHWNAASRSPHRRAADAHASRRCILLKYVVALGITLLGRLPFFILRPDFILASLSADRPVAVSVGVVH
jgi:hypothetical protein